MTNTAGLNNGSGEATARPFYRASNWLRLWALLGALLAGAGRAQAQATMENLAIQASAVGLTGPPRIKLSWPADAQATSYSISRAIKDRTSLPRVNFASLPGTAIEFIDSSAALGITYEYALSKRSNGERGNGFVVAGMEAAAVESRGVLVLVVDATHAAYLAADIERLQRDLVGDGWRVLRHDVAPTMPPPQVRALIRADYVASQMLVQAVLLLGHVAVPYSGSISPDGHPDHDGAWPADAYYGDLNATWTDTGTNVGASRPANRNAPGDGKFDQSEFPAEVRLQIGRIDLANMPAFGLPERDLLRRYLQKDHDYRHKVFAVAQRGLVDDNFGLSTGEDFANNGWRNFAPLCGAANVVAADYLSTLRTQDYAWAYGCGPGSYTGISGVVSTADYAAGPVKSVFNMSFGSYLGDWDNENNVLRAPLAAEGYALTSCWAGRPDWSFCHMGMGETIGYCTRLSQNGSFGSRGQFGVRSVHVALMGDPTLRQHVVAPPAALTATASAGQANLAWAASPDAGAGYYVYRAHTPAGPFFRLTPQPIAALTFTDPAPLPGTSTYLVRARQLTTGASGSYYNLSQGLFVDFTTVTPSANITWQGAQSVDWNTAANWSTGAVPTTYDVATIAAATPFAPRVAAAAAVRELVLAPQAQLTVAAGGSIQVRTALQLQPAAGLPATSLVLAPGTAAAPGGRLLLPDHATPQSGLVLPAGTSLTVGNFAEVNLMGHFAAAGGTLLCSPRGKLTFANDPTAATFRLEHTITTTAPVAVGVLAIDGAAETLVLNGPVHVLGQVLNPATIITNGQLTLRAGPGQQARMTPVVPAVGRALTLGAYVGNVRVEVYVDGSSNAGVGYRHLSAPVAGGTVNSFATASFAPEVNPLFNTQGSAVTPAPTVLRYNQARIGMAGVAGPVGFDQGWLSPAALTEPLVAGSGYAVHMPGNATLSFDGPAVTTAQLSKSGLARGPAADAGWHLLGNPYASPLDWDLVMRTGAGNYLSTVNKALYLFKSKGPYAGAYSSYLPKQDTLAGISVNGGTNVVPVGQSYFVRRRLVSTSGLVTLTLATLLTTPDSTSGQGGVAETRPRLVLALRNAAGTLAHQTAIYFQDGATETHDPGYDALYLASTGQPLALTSTSGAEAFSINGLPLLDSTDVAVPLQLNAATAGTYELAVDALANLPAGYRAYLLDAVGGTYTNLAVTPVAAVQLAAGVPLVGRFSIVFSKQALVLATAPAALAALVSLAPNPAHHQAALVLPRALRARQATTVTILNTLGQTVGQHRFGPGAPEMLDLPLVGLAPGLYIVRVLTAVGAVSRRLVVE